MRDMNEVRALVQEILEESEINVVNQLKSNRKFVELHVNLNAV